MKSCLPLIRKEIMNPLHVWDKQHIHVLMQNGRNPSALAIDPVSFILRHWYCRSLTLKFGNACITLIWYWHVAYFLNDIAHDITIKLVIFLLPHPSFLSFFYYDDILQPNSPHETWYPVQELTMLSSSSEAPGNEKHLVTFYVYQIQTIVLVWTGDMWIIH